MINKLSYLTFSSAMVRTRGPGKGERSQRLAAELLDGRHSDFIYACHTCYACFDTEKKFAVHRDDAHPEGMDNGECHTEDPNQFNCPKCDGIFVVKHLGRREFFATLHSLPISRKKTRSTGIAFKLSWLEYEGQIGSFWDPYPEADPGMLQKSTDLVFLGFWRTFIGMRTENVLCLWNLSLKLSGLVPLSIFFKVSRFDQKVLIQSTDGSPLLCCYEIKQDVLASPCL